MCYSKESSLYTSVVSSVAIVYLLSSGIPHFQWLGVTLAGLCAMQFVEYLLWSEEPDKKCTERNKLITASLVPAAVFLQGVAGFYGSLYVFPWKSSSDIRKATILLFTLISAVTTYFANFHNPTKECTIVTEEGHLDWGRTDFAVMDTVSGLGYYAWLLVLFASLWAWNRSYIFLAAFLALPMFGFFYGRYATDSQATIWCYYGAWASVIAAGGLALKQAGIYDVLRA
jgi:hypothetical protein